MEWSSLMTKIFIQWKPLALMLQIQRLHMINKIIKPGEFMDLMVFEFLDVNSKGLINADIYIGVFAFA